MNKKVLSLELKLIVACAFILICTLLMAFGFFFTSGGPNFLEGISIFGGWIGFLVVLLYPYFKPVGERLRIFVKRVAYAHLVLMLLVSAVLFGPREIGIYIFESGVRRNELLAHQHAMRVVRGQCKGSGAVFDACWDAAFKRETDKYLSSK